jgi:hypothetical protein
MVLWYNQVSAKAAPRKGAKMSSKDAVDIPEKVLQPFGEYDPNVAWDIATRDVDQVTGHDLAKDEVLDCLVGVPFLVTKMTFNAGDAGKRENYVSCAAQLAPRAEMERRRVNVSMLPFDPGDLVVFNDGSTGIYRQCVAYLHQRGFITLPDPVMPRGEGPRWNDKEKVMVYVCSYDLPASQWTDFRSGEVRWSPSGAGVFTINVRLLAKRGIRISEYQNDWTQDGKTRYFA